MALTPEIIIHATAAIGAVVTGPVALWARKGRQQRPRLHRAFGYAWVTLMTITSISALFIHGRTLPNIAGYSPIHLLVPVMLFGLLGSFVMLARGNIAAHRWIMQRLYIGSCVVAGAFTLAPNRLMGRLVWGNGNYMIVHILSNTPLWVWAMLAALVVLGLSQAKARTAGIARVAFMPVAMTGLSIWGIVSAFGSSPMFGYVMLAWMFGASLTLALVVPTDAPAGTAYDAETRTFALPGSWTPMVLIMGTFLTKYAVGVMLAMQIGLARDGLFTLMVGCIYGLFSGTFAGRAVRLMRLAYQDMPLGRPMLNT
jgi:uncharacterized membrane protein